MPLTTKEKRSAEVVKRRACDECRGRKLACSKEPDGCSRCRRERVPCVYSAQKPMGRPRKRAVAEEGLTATPSAPESQDQQSKTTNSEAQIAALVPAEISPTVIMPEFDSTIAMDLDFSFLDMDSSDIPFLDLLGPADTLSSWPATQPTVAPEFTATPLKSTNPQPPNDQSNPGSSLWMSSNHFGSIDFDFAPAPAPAAPETPLLTSDQINQIMSAEVVEPVPALSPPSTDSISNPPSNYPSPGSSGSSSSSSGQQSCTCLSTLYTTLASLNPPPKTFLPLMKATRAAARVAHDTINCESCCNPPIAKAGWCSNMNGNHNIPVVPLQSTLLLAAVLPSIASAYTRILSLVDSTAAEATEKGELLTFSLSEYGGLWGAQMTSIMVKCGGAARLEGARLEPILWRLTVRALLKVDVYGINEFGPEATTAPYCAPPGGVPGLKHIITRMEERSKVRHRILDEMVQRGKIKVPPGATAASYIPLSSAVDKPNCLRILDIAKKSIDELIIP